MYYSTIHRAIEPLELYIAKSGPEVYNGAHHTDEIRSISFAYISLSCVCVCVLYISLISCCTAAQHREKQNGAQHISIYFSCIIFSPSLLFLLRVELS